MQGTTNLTPMSTNKILALPQPRSCWSPVFSCPRLLLEPEQLILVPKCVLCEASEHSRILLRNRSNPSDTSHSPPCIEKDERISINTLITAHRNGVHVDILKKPEPYTAANLFHDSISTSSVTLPSKHLCSPNYTIEYLLEELTITP